MKTVKMLLTSLFFLAITFATVAQDKTTDYFAGDWKVVVKGTPNGDAEMVMHLERVDGELVGEMRADGIDPAKFRQVLEKEAEITVSYFAMGYDVSINLKKVDDNNLKGSLLGMFDATGERKLD
nr:hypothetical protein [uncultured Draconibacterium sp.]